jgi:hypothetical protein
LRSSRAAVLAKRKTLPRIEVQATLVAKSKEPGASVKLVLETFADHEELVPELISDTLKEDFDLKLYTDVNL